jgi:hypothetical protein
VGVHGITSRLNRLTGIAIDCRRDLGKRPVMKLAMMLFRHLLFDPRSVDDRA